MAFKRDYQPVGVEYVQQQKKRLPYTVTDIGGPAELAHWKAEQRRIEDEFRVKEAARFEAAKEGLFDGSLAAKDAAGGYGESATTKAYKRYQEDQAKQVALSAKVNMAENSTLKPKLSILTRIYNWCLNKFLEIKL